MPEGALSLSSVPSSCEKNCRPVKADQDVLLTVTLGEETPVAVFSWYLDDTSPEKVRCHSHSEETMSSERTSLMLDARS